MEEKNLKEMHESDLTKKERRLLEKQKLQEMSFAGKLEYIWMYYKGGIFGLIALIILVFVGIDIYQNIRTEDILSITVVNAGMCDTEAYAEELRDLLGAEGRYEQVEIVANLTTDEEGRELQQYAQMAFITHLQADVMDVVVMPEPLYESFKDQGIFADLKEVLGETLYASFGDAIDEGHLKADGDALGEFMPLSYEPVCITVIKGSAHTENAAKWIASLGEES